jgi:ligand-binding sensor domain-containing protein
MSKIYTALFCTLLLAFCIKSVQAQVFTNYYSQSDIRALLFDGTSLWSGTSGGLQVRNLDGSIKTSYTKDGSGLVTNAINKIVNDNKGLKWVGTFGGVASFDGAKWETFNAQNSALAGAAVRDIAVDINNYKWMATNAGIFKFDGLNWTRYDAKAGLLDENALAVAARNTNIWVGTQEKGLFKFDGITWSNYTIANSKIPSNTVQNLTFDATGKLWLATDKGIAAFDEAQFTAYNKSNSGIPFENITKIAIDNQGVKWMTAANEGVIAFDGNTWKTYNTKNSSLKSNDIHSLTTDAQGATWVGYDGALAKILGGNVTIFPTTEASIPSNDLRYVGQDPTGNIWVGTFDKGASRLDGAKWVTYNQSNSTITSNYVQSFQTDKSGAYWFGTNNGASKLNGNTWTQYNSFNGLVSYYVKDMLRDAKNDLWLATHDGISKWDGVKFTNFTTKDGLINNKVDKIALDATGNLWFATNGGLSKYDGIKFTNFTKDNGLPSNVLTCVFVDKTGKIWIGSDNGIAVFDGTSWKKYAQTDGLINNKTNTLVVDNQNIVWIGTDTGLSSFDGTKWLNFTEQNSSLPDNIVRSLLVDKDGKTLWIATYNGLSKVGAASNFTVTVSATNQNCSYNKDGRIKATVSGGGTAPFNYKWSNGATTDEQVGLGAGRYTVTVSDATGAAVLANGTINVSPALEAFATGVNESTLNGKNGIAKATASGGTPPYKYTWETEPKQFTQNISNLAPYCYSVVVTDANNCNAAAAVCISSFGCTNTVSVALETVGFSCNGGIDGKITPKITGGTAPYTYAWSNTASTESITNLKPGRYGVIVTDSKKCIGSAVVDLQQSNLLFANVTVINITKTGANDGKAIANPTGGKSPYAFAWSNGSNTNTISGLTSGKYTVTVTDASGCKTTQMVFLDVTTAAQEPVWASEVKMFPNPANGYVTIQLPDHVGNISKIQVIDVLGSVVSSSNFQGTNVTLPVTDLKTGIYIVKIEIDKQDILIRKILIKE